MLLVLLRPWPKSPQTRTGQVQLIPLLGETQTRAPSLPSPAVGEWGPTSLPSIGTSPGKPARPVIPERGGTERAGEGKSLSSCDTQVRHQPTLGLEQRGRWHRPSEMRTTATRFGFAVN